MLFVAKIVSPHHNKGDAVASHETFSLFRRLCGLRELYSVERNQNYHETDLKERVGGRAAVVAISDPDLRLNPAVSYQRGQRFNDYKQRQCNFKLMYGRVVMMFINRGCVRFAKEWMERKFFKILWGI